MELNTILNLMSAYNLTADELLLIYITLLARDEEGNATYFSQWFNNGGRERLRDLFSSLKEKGVILKSYNPEAYIPNDIEFNKNFLRKWYKFSGEMGQELLNAYPPFLNIQGKYVPLKDVSKRFASLDDFFNFYATQIGSNPEKHKEVMEILNWAKENNLLNFGILNFVISNQWNNLKELRDNPEMVPIYQDSILTDD